MMDNEEDYAEDQTVKEVSKQFAQEIAVDFLKKKKSPQKIDVAAVEQSREDWVIRGTCPIDLEGHPWAERFEVVIDQKGKVKSSFFALL
jgi:hypothetical protein